MFDSIINELEELAMQSEKNIGLCELYTEAYFSSGQEDAFRKCIEIVNWHKEKSNGWIYCNEKMPEEYDSIFSKFKGTDKWNEAMFEKKSNEAIVACELEDGEYTVTVSYTLDGEWKTEKDVVKKKVIAWMPMPQPPKETRKYYTEGEAKELRDKIKSLKYKNTNITFTFKEAQAMQGMLTLYNNVTAFDSKTAKRMAELIDFFASEIETMKNNEHKEFHKVFDIVEIRLMKGAIC